MVSRPTIGQERTQSSLLRVLLTIVIVIGTFRVFICESIRGKAESRGCMDRYLLVLVG